jgi:hypothetical protein
MSLGTEVFLILNALNIPLHLIGDFLLQTNAQAQHKSNSDRHCAAHAATHGALYLFPLVVLIGRGGALAAAVIAIAHYAVDRYSLARLVPMLRQDAPVPYWVEKVADATLHIACNALVFLVAAWAIS